MRSTDILTDTPLEQPSAFFFFFFFLFPALKWSPLRTNINLCLLLKSIAMHMIFIMCYDE